MPIPQNFERAQLVIDGGEPIECAFNPQEYSITKTNVWTIKPVTGTDTPKPEFGGGMPWTIRVQLLLDASLKGADASHQGRRDEAAEDDGVGRRGRRRVGAAVRDLQVGLDREPEDGRQLAAASAS